MGIRKTSMDKVVPGLLSVLAAIMLIAGMAGMPSLTVRAEDTYMTSYIGNATSDMTAYGGQDNRTWDVNGRKCYQYTNTSESGSCYVRYPGAVVYGSNRYDLYMYPVLKSGDKLHVVYEPKSSENSGCAIISHRTPALRVQDDVVTVRLVVVNPSTGAGVDWMGWMGFADLDSAEYCGLPRNDFFANGRHVGSSVSSYTSGGTTQGTYVVNNFSSTHLLYNASGTSSTSEAYTTHAVYGMVHIPASGGTFVYGAKGDRITTIGVAVPKSISIPSVTYRITFNANGGSGSVPSQKTVTGDNTAVGSFGSETPAPPSGKTFAGWSATSAGEKVFCDTSQLNSWTIFQLASYVGGSLDSNQNLTLYAQWADVVLTPINVPGGTNYTYDGVTKYGVSSGTGYTIGGTNSAVNAGTYYATVSPSSGYKWSDGTTGSKTITWYINRAPISVPSGTNYTYDGGTKTGVATGSYYTRGGTYSATNAGNYTATVTPDKNHQWNSGSNVTGARDVKWSIAKAERTVTASSTSLELTYPDSTNFTWGCSDYNDKNPTYTSTDTSVVTLSWSDSMSAVVVTPVNTGSCSIKLHVDEGANYLETSLSIPVTVKPGTIEVSSSDQIGYYVNKDLSPDGIIVSEPATGATVKYSESTTLTRVTTTYTRSTPPTVRNAGSYTVQYQVSAPNYLPSMGSYDVVINNANISVTAPDKTAVYTGSAISAGGITVNDPASGATVRYGTSSGTYNLTSPPTRTTVGTTTVYYKVTADNYNDKTGSYKLTINNADISLDATNTTATYSGESVQPDPVTVMKPSSGATIRYGETSGSCTLTSPKSYTNVGTYTVYYSVSASNYNTKTGSYKLIIKKAKGSVTPWVAEKGLDYPDNASFSFSRVGDGTMSVTSDESVVRVSLSGGTVNLTPVATGSCAVTISEGEGTNYLGAAGSVNVTVNEGTIEVDAPDETAYYTGSDVRPVGITVNAPVTGAVVKYSTSTARTRALLSYTETAPPAVRDAGSYRVFYEVSAPNYTTMSGSFGVDINNANISVEVPHTSVTYDGTEKTPDGIRVLDPASGATVKYGTAPGSYTLANPPKFTASGIHMVYYQVTAENYNTLTGSYAFTINPATIIVSTKNESKAYNGNDQEPAHVTVLSPDSGYEVLYKGDNGRYYLDNPLSFRDVGIYTVEYQVTAENFTTKTGSYTYEITRKPIAVPSAVSGLIYNGEEQTGVPAGDGYTVTGNTGTSATSYTATVSVDGNHQWSDGTVGDKSVLWSIGRKSIPIPEKTDYTYDGTEKTGVPAGEGYSLSGDTKGIAVGTYVATAATDENHVWDDGTTDDKPVTWFISNSAILSSVENRECVFDNEYHSPDTVKAACPETGAVVKYGTEFGTYDLDEPLTYKDAGVYNIYYQITADNYNTVWGFYTLTIKRKPVDVPEAVTGLTYNTRPQTGVPAGEGYTLTGNVKTDAGSYTAVAKLGNNYKWSDNTAGYKEIGWSIGRDKPTLTVPDQVVYYPDILTVAYISNSDGSVTASSGDEDTATVSYENNVIRVTPLKAGNVNITLTQEATQNYEAAIKTFIVSVVRSPSSISPIADRTIFFPETEEVPIVCTGNGTLSAESSNEGVATVSVNELNLVLTPLGEGKAIITLAQAESGQSFGSSVMFVLTVVKEADQPVPDSEDVRPEVCSITLDTDYLELTVGDFAAVTARTYPSSVVPQGFTWTIDDKDAITLANPGDENRRLVTANRMGTYTLTVTETGSGLSASCLIRGIEYYDFAKKGNLVTSSSDHEIRRIKNKLYCFDSLGRAGAGFITVNGETFYFDPDTGAAVKGLQSIKGSLYFFNRNTCVMVKDNKVMVNGRTYHFGFDGRAAGGAYYLHDGKDAKAWFCFDDKACLQSGVFAADLPEGNNTGDRLSSVGGENEKALYYFKGGKLYKPKKEGFITVKGYKYYIYTDGHLATGLCTITDRNGIIRTYAFNEDDGKLMVGARMLSGNRLVPIDRNGQVITSIKKPGLTKVGPDYYWYELDSHGAVTVLTGWKDAVGKDGSVKATYYFDPDTGASTSGLRHIDGVDYVFIKGACVRKDGVVRVDADRYALKVDGRGYKGSSTVQYGLSDINGRTYYADEATGIIQTGLLALSGNILSGNALPENLCFTSKSGEFQKDKWVRINKHRYHTDGNGALQTGRISVNNRIYYLDPESIPAGAMKTGLVEEPDEFVYLYVANGVLQTGNKLVTYKGRRYYVDNGGKVSGIREGILRVKDAKKGEITYVLDSDGALLNGTKANEDGGLFLYRNGILVSGMKTPERGGEGSWKTVNRKKYLVGYSDSPLSANICRVGKYKDPKGNEFLLKEDGSMASAELMEIPFDEVTESMMPDKIGRYWYYYNKKGQKVTRAGTSDSSGWYRVGAKYAYIYESGCAASGWTKIGNETYWFDPVTGLTNATVSPIDRLLSIL